MRQLLFTLFALAVVAALAPGAAQAQDFHHGPKGGINVSTFRGEFDDPMLAGLNFGYKPGFTVGWHFIFEVNDAFSVQPEVFYSRRSAEAGGRFFIPPVGNIQASLETTLDYVEIPLLFKITVNTDGSAEPVLFAGPSIGFNTRAKVAVVQNGESEIQDIRDDVEKLEVGLVLGGGVVFGRGPVSYSLDARYVWEFRGFLKPETDGQNGDFRAGTFAVLFGVII